MNYTIKIMFISGIFLIWTQTLYNLLKYLCPKLVYKIHRGKLLYALWIYNAEVKSIIPRRQAIKSQAHVRKADDVSKDRERKLHKLYATDYSLG
jgi:hypothetical protein